VLGAEPLFFLDYFSCGKLHVDTATAVVSGIAAGCEQAGCALIGGETAEMPGMYPTGEYDLAGFAVGAVEKKQIIDGKNIQPGDIVIGLASSGAHSNGYSLIRKIIDNNQIDLAQDFYGKPLHETIMAPTRIYAKPLLALMSKLPIKGLAHITGGGLVENLPRILPEQTMAVLQKNSWETPPLFKWLQQQGNISDTEMARVFNCGIGMALVIAHHHVDDALQLLRTSGETVWPIGEIKLRTGNDAPTILV
ncbi:MAG: phosphoribosylformylglycinamidine cyclo-ligase, partial [Nitrosomonas sp.]|nr:phosphoribosylformylglycinamidine cyclo-ligase [Nitrosomonas sp.]